MKLNSHVNIEYNLPISLFLFILIGTPCYQTFKILTGSDIPLVVIVTAILLIVLLELTAKKSETRSFQMLLKQFNLSFVIKLAYLKHYKQKLLK